MPLLRIARRHCRVSLIDEEPAPFQTGGLSCGSKLAHVHQRLGYRGSQLTNLVT
jgi:hypothetical protein